MKNIYKNI